MRIRPLLHLMPLVGLASLGFALWSVANSNEPRDAVPPPLPPAISAYEREVAGRGIVEPASEIVQVASDLDGIVAAVPVRPGDEVREGDLLFALDDRRLRADLGRAEAELAAAAAGIGELERQIELQRARIEQAGADMAVAEAERSRATADRERYARLESQDFASGQRFEAATADARKAEAGVQGTKAALASARSQLAVFEAGLARARADREGAAAAADRVRVDLAKTQIRSTLRGTVLTVDVRVGERVTAAVAGTPPVRVGLLEPLHVRVDIDEADAWRVRDGAPARAQLRGNPQIAADLAFVRIEPYVQPKRSLTGAGAERVDTRVLQVIYAVDPALFPARVGQQVDVHIDARGAEALVAVR